MSAKSMVIIICSCISLFLALFLFNIMSEYLSPGAFTMTILIMHGAVILGVLIECKSRERACERARSEFREKHPPASVTRLSIKRK